MRALDETFSSIWCVQKFIFKNNLITLFSRFTFIPKLGIGLPETGIIFVL